MPICCPPETFSLPTSKVTHSDDVKKLESGMDATMALFWGSIELIKEELDTAREVADSRMSCPHALCFAMFVSKTTKTPRHACDGDICVTVDSVFVWLNERWITGILQSHLTKHPFLPNRSLALHPSGFMLCWATESQRLTYALPSWWPKPHKKYAEKFLGPDELPVYQEKIKDPPVSGLFLKPLNEITCAEAALLLNSTLCARVQVTPELQRKCSRTAVERTHIASIPPSSSPALFSPSVVPHKDSSSSSSSSDTSSTPLSPLVPSSDELSSRSLCRDSDDTPTASHANITAEGSSSTMITVTPTQGRSDCLQVEHTANTQMSDDLFHVYHAPSLQQERPSDETFDKSKYIRETLNGAPVRNYTFFNGVVVSATPQVKIEGVSEAVIKADEKMLDWLSSEGKDATAPMSNGKPFAETINVPSGLEDDCDIFIDILKRARAISAEGRVALLQPIRTQKFIWNKKLLGLITTGVPEDLSLAVEYQSTNSRHTAHQIHRNSNEFNVKLTKEALLEEFVEAAKTSQDPGNCLDISRTGGYVPVIIDRLSDDCTAWDRTSSLGFFVGPKKADKSESGEKKVGDKVEDGKGKNDGKGKGSKGRGKGSKSKDKSEDSKGRYKGIIEAEDAIGSSTEDDASVEQRDAKVGGNREGKAGEQSTLGAKSHRYSAKKSSDRGQACPVAKKAGSRRVQIGKRKRGDCSNSDGEDENHHSPKRIRHDNVFSDQEDPQPNMPKASQEACERSTREEWQGNPEPSTAENSNQGPSTSTTPEFTFTYNCTNGNGAVSYGRDIDKWRRWLLLTTAMFFTWPHHDASGLCTWMLLTCGLKIWCYIVPKDLADNPTEASKAYIELIRASNHIALPTEELLPGIAEVYIVFLEPDVLLIQPPGIMHAVLTPTETISFGGHFLMHDTLHLMEWTRALSHHCDRVGTNDLHPEIQRAISRMMIALSTRPGQKVPRKQFLALARQVLYKADYWRSENDKKNQQVIPAYLKAASKNTPYTMKESIAEADEAERIAKAILEYNGLQAPEPLHVNYSQDTHPAAVSFSIPETRPLNNPAQEPQNSGSPDHTSKGLEITEIPRLRSRKQGKATIPDLDNSPWNEPGEHFIEIPPFARAT